MTRIVIYGTKARPAPTTATKRRTATGVDALNWAALAQCESSGNPRAVGGGGLYFGLYQFNLSTWHGVGGVGNPIDASAAEQTYRAKLLYREPGLAAVAGLRPPALHVSGTLRAAGDWRA